MAQVHQQTVPLQQTIEVLQAQVEALTAYLAVGPALALSPHSTAPVTVVARLEQVLRRAGEPLHYEILRRGKVCDAGERPNRQSDRPPE
jgi:hypothetical protein